MHPTILSRREASAARWSAPGALLVAWLVLLPGGGEALAQGLPAYRSTNPVITSRSALEFLPLVERHAGWRTGITLDYGSPVELSNGAAASYVLDAEILRLTATVSRDLGPRAFVQVNAGVGGAYAGFLDAPLNWYHRFTGLDEKSRRSRPENQFDYTIVLPDGTTVTRDPSDFFLEDLRATAGWRLTPHWQAALTVVLPTSTAPVGYGVRVPAFALTTTARSAALGTRVTFEGGGGVGVTPRNGELAPWQHAVFAAANTGVRVRFIGQQSAFVNAYLHSPVYEGTGLRSLDRSEFALDFGFLFKPGGGPELLAGLTEDLSPSGPAVDLVFRLGARW